VGQGLVDLHVEELVAAHVHLDPVVQAGHLAHPKPSKSHNPSPAEFSEGRGNSPLGCGGSGARRSRTTSQASARFNKRFTQTRAREGTGKGPQITVSGHDTPRRNKRQTPVLTPMHTRCTHAGTTHLLHPQIRISMTHKSQYQPMTPLGSNGMPNPQSRLSLPCTRATHVGDDAPPRPGA
jgi:hypothetical protein